MNVRSKGWLALMLGGLSGACGAQATPDYYGDLLGVAHGLVSNPDGVQVDDARVLANWGDVGQMFGPSHTFADVHGSFPASFTLDFYDPPPEAIMFTPADLIGSPPTGSYYDPSTFKGTRQELAAARGSYYDPAHESRIAIAHILAVRDGTSSEHLVGDIVGGDEHHAIVYIESDIEQDSYGEALFSGRPKAGYHIYEIREVAQADWRDIRFCQAAAADVAAWKHCGIATPFYATDASTKLDVRLVNAQDELHFQNTTAPWVNIGAQLDEPDAPIICDENDPMTRFRPECQ